MLAFTRASRKRRLTSLSLLNDGVPMTLNFDVTDILTGLVLLIVSIGARGLYALASHVRDQNGKIGKLNDWATYHEKLDAERLESIKANLDSIRKRLDAS